MNKLFLCCLFLLLMNAQPASAAEQTVNFTATPEQCVALHKGQTCYQNIQFKWQTPNKGKYCLLQAADSQRVICWEGNFLQHYEYSFERTNTTAYRLIEQSTDRILAEVKVVVIWVYKAPKQSQSGWRLF
ncbi:DUF3019 domain-containing protein [Vibrio artabrorum]|uniref:DUF3019 domain-containing protein n=1 Tax=Vibrio artabrorum TaxID=446374 RepID=A0ABT8CKW0_9VIBR|nr:DUF3019 domain-containing protein [Vibrio artabrorum]MDN3702382.1 DUF3019 domain-containing protein [Vibrio artabrorum]